MGTNRALRWKQVCMKYSKPKTQTARRTKRNAKTLRTMMTIHKASILDILLLNHQTK